MRAIFSREINPWDSPAGILRAATRAGKNVERKEEKERIASIRTIALWVAYEDGMQGQPEQRTGETKETEISAI